MAKLRCRESTDLLPLWREGELSGEERRALEEHCAGCASCRQEVEQYRSLSVLSGRLLKEGIPPAPFQNAPFFKEHLHPISRPPTYFWWRAKKPWVYRVTALAALLLLSIGVGTVYVTYFSPVPKTGDRGQGTGSREQGAESREQTLQTTHPLQKMELPAQGGPSTSHDKEGDPMVFGADNHFWDEFDRLMDQTLSMDSSDSKS